MEYASLINGWNLLPSWQCYIAFALIASLGVRVLLAILKKFEGESFWKSIGGVGAKEKNNDDYWHPFILGFLEFISYPILMVTNHWYIIGAWLSFKTLAQWERWSKERKVFNRFLIGNVIVLILSLLWLTSYIKLINGQEIGQLIERGNITMSTELLSNSLFILLQSFPFVILIIVLIFYKEIKNKIKEMVQAKVGDKQLNFQPNITAEDKDKKLDEMEKNFKDNPKKAKSEYLKLLERYLYERILNLIFGTQIVLLESLEKITPKGIKYENLRVYWLEHCRLSNNKNYSFVSYINFLKMSLLINITDDVVILSKGGKRFLDYIRTMYPLVYHSKAY